MHPVLGMSFGLVLGPPIMGAGRLAPLCRASAQTDATGAPRGLGSSTNYVAAGGRSASALGAPHVSFRARRGSGP